MDLHAIPAPADFPASWYDKVNHLFETSGRADRNTREQLRGGWNAVAFRFLAAARWDEEWRESLAEHGTAPPPDQRLRQETAVFGFCVASMSVLESFCYAAFASAALERPTAFAEVDAPAPQRRITPALTRDRLQAQFPDAALTAGIAAMLASRPYAITAEAAADKVAPFARFSRVEMYVKDVAGWDRALGLTSVPRGGNLVLIQPADSGVFDGSFERDEVLLTSRPQLYVDLVRRGGAAGEAAAFMRERGELWPQ